MSSPVPLILGGIAVAAGGYYLYTRQSSSAVKLPTGQGTKSSASSGGILDRVSDLFSSTTSTAKQATGIASQAKNAASDVNDAWKKVTNLF